MVVDKTKKSDKISTVASVISTWKFLQKENKKSAWQDETKVVSYESSLRTANNKAPWELNNITKPRKFFLKIYSNNHVLLNE